MSLAQQIYDRAKGKKSEALAAAAGSYIGGGFLDHQLAEENLVEMPSIPEKITEFTGLPFGSDKINHFGFSGAAAKGAMIGMDKAGLSPSQQFALVNAATVAGGSAFEMKYSRNFSQADMYANLLGANTAYLQHNGHDILEGLKSKAGNAKERLEYSEESMENTYGSSSKFDLFSNQEERKSTVYDSRVESYLTEDVDDRTDIQRIIEEFSSTRRDKDETAYLATRMIEEYGGALKKDVEESEYEEDIQEVVSNVFSEENLAKEEKTKRALTAAVNRYEFDYGQEDIEVDKIETKSTEPVETGKLHEKVDKIETKQRFDNESYEGNSSAILC
ncbi:MAG: hypothetical protein ABEK04_01995 [Candidatus Nanohalobium sp.]